LVTGGGYNMLDVAGSVHPAAPQVEHASGISTTSTANAVERDLTRIATTSASCCGDCGHRNGASTRTPTHAPRRRSTTPTCRRSDSFVSASVRHGVGDPAVEETEQRLSVRRKSACLRSPCTVATTCCAGVAHRASSRPVHRLIRRRVIPKSATTCPKEAPREFAEAVLSLI